MADTRSHSPTLIFDRLEPRRPPRLEVYVSRECLNCAEAVRLAEDTADRFPSVEVQVIDLGGELENRLLPDTVVAVPTYLLDGRVISLGNPYPEDLFARLHEAVG